MAFVKAQPAAPKKPVKRKQLIRKPAKKEKLYEGEEDFEPWEMFDKFLQHNLDSSVFNLIDESDVKKAPNVVEWFIGREYLGLDISPPYPKQIQFALELFEDFCPDCSDKHTLQHMFKQTIDEILDKIVLLQYGVCPKCSKTRGDFHQQGIFTYPDELAVCGGQRIGKSFEVGLIASYQLHRFLTLGVPYRYFHQQPSSIFMMTFTAVDFTQAMDNLFEPFAGMITNSPWFNEYHELLDYYANKHGLPAQWEFPKESLGYVHKRLNVGPASPNFRKMRGRTRFFFCLAEDTRIWTPYGSCLISDVFPTNPAKGFTPMVGLQLLTDDGFKNVSKVYYEEDAPILEVTTDSGYVVKGTPNHPVWVCTSEGEIKQKSLETLTTADWVVISKDIRFADSNPDISFQPNGNPWRYKQYPDVMTVELGKLLGYLMAEGDISPKGVRFISSDSDIQQDFEKCFEACFGLTPKVAQYVSETDTTIWRTSCQSPHVSSFFKHLGFWGNSRTKQTPSIIWKCNRETIRSYLSGLFDGDGYSESSFIRLQLMNAGVIEDTQMLLLGFGIVSKRSLDKRGISSLVLYGSYADKFRSDIGFVCQYKQDVPTQIRLSERTPFQSQILRKYRLPYSYKYMCEDGQARRFSFGQFFRAEYSGGASEFASYHDLEEVDLNAVGQINSSVAYNLRTLLQNRDRFYYDKVASIILSEQCKVYDFEVPDGHTFIQNVIVGGNSIDEIGWFDFGDESKKKVTLSADGIYAALNNSLRTIRSEAKAKQAGGLYDVPTGLAVNASSPSNINDMIMKLIREGADMPKRKVFHLATWEAHPRMTYADIAAEITNPLELARDFEAVPPLAANPFIHDDDTVFRAIDVDRDRRFLTGIQDYHTDSFGKKSACLKLTIHRASKQIPRVLSVDPGVSHDSFGLSMLSFYPPDITMVDDVLECKPEPGCPVNFHLLFNDVIVPIIEKFYIVAVVYDQWQSQMQMDEIRTKYHTLSEQIALVWDDFVNFRSALLSAKLKFPNPEKPAMGIKDPSTDIDVFSKNAPRLKLIAQLLMVNEAGRKVTKPQGCKISDDIFRSVVVGEKYIRENINMFLKGRFRNAPGAGAIGNLKGYTPLQGIGGPASIKSPYNQYGATKHIQHQSSEVGVVAGRNLVQGPNNRLQRGVKQKPKSFLFYGDRKL